MLSVSGEGVSGICGKVLGELDRFTESALDDDIALVSLSFTGSIVGGDVGRAKSLRLKKRASSELFWGTMVV
ncbi:MAG: hypothetical protein ACLU37_12270 [Collinsella sp.]